MSGTQQAARDQFEKLGWPHRKQEGWQWCDFASDPPDIDDIAATMPQLRAADKGLARAGGGLSLPRDAHGLLALNIARCDQALHIDVGRDQRLSDPIHLDHDNGCAQFALALGAGAEAVCYEVVKADRFANLFAQITLGEGAKLTHVRIFDQPQQAISFTHHHIRLAKDAQFELDLICDGARRQRVDHLIALEGAGASAHLRAALLALGQRQADIGAEIRHLAPDGRSLNMLRAILTDLAQGGFRARGYIAEGAQRSDLHQLAKAMVLSPEARMHTKPELAIYHDDVQCSHGVAVGALDPEALFYLGARAIADDLARRILLEGFLADMLTDEPLALALTRLDQLIDQS